MIAYGVAILVKAIGNWSWSRKERRAKGGGKPFWLALKADAEETVAVAVDWLLGHSVTLS
jgi:hypothetical protein